MPADVFIYTTPYCPFCLQAKALLSSKGVAFTEIHVENRPDLRRWLVERTGNRTVPQVFINGGSAGGYTDLDELDTAGQLDTLLAEEPPPPDSDGGPDLRR